MNADDENRFRPKPGRVRSNRPKAGKAKSFLTQAKKLAASTATARPDPQCGRRSSRARTPARKAARPRAQSKDRASSGARRGLLHLRKQVGHHPLHDVRKWARISWKRKMSCVRCQSTPFHLPPITASFASTGTEGPNADGGNMRVCDRAAEYQSLKSAICSRSVTSSRAAASPT